MGTVTGKAWNFAGAPFENVPESESGAMGGAVAPLCLWNGGEDKMGEKGLSGRWA